jgi:phosphopantothenoylcysteine decarboxylase/phosphopantothenate--cysteine ligase
MGGFLANKRILLGVTGSIAAYKSADLVRRLREAGALVRVAMTENAQRFITPLTMQAVSGNPVHQALFDLQAEAAMGHIELARWADVVLVAPATADFMARLANGNADDLLTTLCLATAAPIALAPAMNQGMWNNTLTQRNLQALQQKEIHIFGPAQGTQACGDVGLGRMLEPNDIIAEVNKLFATSTLSGVNVLVTAGPTHEAIDPIRFISNGSSGKMGFALAEAAHEAGATVTLISGPVGLPQPDDINYRSVTSAQEMYDLVMKSITDCDIFLAVAAVSDYRSQVIAKQKMHKEEGISQLILERTPDIVQSVGELPNKPFIVGFAAETDHLLENARRKRKQKKMDLIIANQIMAGQGMGADENAVTVIGLEKEVTFPLIPKSNLARQLIAIIADHYRKTAT